MKYYILNSIDRIKQHSKKIDAESILYNKSWEVFTDDGIKQVFIFRPNSELLLSSNGKVQKGKWELLPNGSMLIDIIDNSYLFKPQFVDNQFLSLQLDGHSDSLIMIDEAVKEQLLLATIEDITNHLIQKYVKEEPPLMEDTEKKSLNSLKMELSVE